MLPQISNNRSLSESLMAGLPVLPDWVPVSWGSDALIRAANGSMSFFLPMILLILFAGVLILLTTTLVEKGFRTGWIRLSEGSGKKKKRKPKKERAEGVSHPVIAIGKKEWFSIKRDMREWMTFLPLAFFIVFPVIGFISGGIRLSDLRGFNDISWPIAQGFFLCIYALFNGQLAASAISREGLSAWILRTLPLSKPQYCLRKTMDQLVTSIYYFNDLGMYCRSISWLGMVAVYLWDCGESRNYNRNHLHRHLDRDNWCTV